KGLSDNWHPNDEGMQRIAEKIYDVSENTLK
ncbi:SGNH/GDSL hydrolase family protein, partial [Enterococcus faecium]